MKKPKVLAKVYVEYTEDGIDVESDAKSNFEALTALTVALAKMSSDTRMDGTSNAKLAEFLKMQFTLALEAVAPGK